MNHNERKLDEAARIPHRPRPLGPMIGTLGAISGAGLGALAAGPPGAIVGGILGAVAGVSSGWAGDEHTTEKLRADRARDDDLGITAGTIGAPNLRHPPARIGAFSAEATGARTAGATTPDDSNGPFEHPTR